MKKKILTLLWPTYMNSNNISLSSKRVLKHFFIQKILRINSHVPWPVHPTSQISSPQNIDRGTRTPGLSRNCYLDARNGIKFGKNVWIGPNVSIISQNHDSANYKKYLLAEKIEIGDNCWIGANVTILPSVKLGNHVIVAAGSVVTKSFEKNDILIGGNPAKIIKELPPYNES